MDIEEAKEISRMGWPENQKAQRQHDAVDWLISEVERLTPPTDAGMYSITNPAYPQVKVGNFTICRQGDHGVWIQREDTEEGGEFRDFVFEPVLAAFWKENF